MNASIEKKSAELTLSEKFEKLNKSHVKRMIKRWNRNAAKGSPVLIFNSKKDYPDAFKEEALDFDFVRKNQQSEETFLIRQNGKAVSVSIMADMFVSPSNFREDFRGEAEKNLLQLAFEYAIKKGYKKVKVCKLDSIDPDCDEVPMGCFNFNDAKPFERIYDYNKFIGYYDKCM